MWIAHDGERDGTIGGGVMELRAEHAAPDWLASEEPPEFELHTLRHRRDDGGGEASGMMCSGWQTNLHGVFTPERDARGFRNASELVRAGQAGTMQITPRGVAVQRAQSPAKSPPIAVSGSGDDWTVTLQLLNPLRAAVLGGGHCGLALSRLLTDLGYDVTVFDVRAEAPAVGREAEVGRVEIVPDYTKAGARIDHPELTHVVVMTSDMPSDVRALLGVVGGPHPYVGVMGSATKAERIATALRAEGVPDPQIAAVRSPIGLPMYSHTPEEIAVSVAAELLAVRPHLFPELLPRNGE